MRKSYEERQAECGLKVGDKVKILRKAEDYEDGWVNDWVPRMSECVGGTGVIRGIYGALGVLVKTDSYGVYFFPYFVLEKVEDEATFNELRSKEMRKSYKERQAECGLKVGDKVKILRKAKDYEDGWEDTWPEEADTWVGKTGEIIGDGFKVFCEEEKDWWNFPYFVLEKVEDEVREKVEDEVTEKVEDEVTEKAKEMRKSYEERHAECGLKVGDKVKILRKAEDYEDGWGTNWAGAYMDDYVGRIGKIVGKRPGAGFLVFCEELDNVHQFPYFVLEKVEGEEFTRYSVFTTQGQGKEFFFIKATSREETSESIIFTEERGGTWEFYKKHIIAIKTV